MKVLTVIGARPQFIKALPVSAALSKADVSEYVVHTGQHYDYKMSQVFFDELNLPEPNINLEVGSGNHGEQTGLMINKIEAELMKFKPDFILLYGDTNSTLAGAIAASKIHIKIAHVEAGLRSFNKKMPEEVNRILTDHVSELLFCPTQSAITNLKNEGILEGVYLTDDVMQDALSIASQKAGSKLFNCEDNEMEKGSYYAATVHRPENTDSIENIESILSALNELDKPVVFPIHPRTKNKLINDFKSLDHEGYSNIKYIDPLGYIDMIRMVQGAAAVLTDSGGLQKEAYWLGVPVVTLRNETEWVETVQSGGNTLAGSDKGKILAAISSIKQKVRESSLKSNGAEQIVEILLKHATV